MKHQTTRQRRPVWLVMAGAAVILAAATAVAVVRHHASADPVNPLPMILPHTPESYLGVYEERAPGSYAGVTAFTQTTGVKPNVLMYYSSWHEPFRVSFAKAAAEHGAVPLVQIEPVGISLGAIASGKYDGYLSSYAAAVSSYRHPVILSFGHEMNGSWYSWGYRHTAPAVFVAAWRHIVTLFRAFGARNVTWLWTINIINTRKNTIPSPAPWWPGSAYVTWVGIDGYYQKPSWKFAPLFGPTLAVVRELTHAPVLISETGAAPSSDQPAKIANLFAGIHAYGLLGFVWFDATGVQRWHITGSASVAAYRRGASSYKSPSS
jgi:mannan endo-1,4-beta-mannosidase